MDLQNMLEAKKNSRVLVNGTVYELDGRGVVFGVKDEDAKKLLQNSKVWRIWTEKQPVKAPEPQKAPRKPEPPPAQPEVAPEPKKAPEPVPEAPQEASEEEDLEEDAPEEDEDEPDEGEWPDPDISMTKDQLREIADAYEVKYTGSTTKAELVDLINEVMYPDGKE